MGNSKREDFLTIKALSAAKNGGQNLDILLVKTRDRGAVYIEKRIARKYVDSEYAARELKAMAQCQGQPNIVDIRAYIFDDVHVTGYASIFMQHCELGDVGGMIERYQKHRKVLSDEGFLWKVFFDCSIALCFLYSGRSSATIRECAANQRSVETKRGWNRMIHLDIKPGNLFITNKNRGDNLHFPNIVLGDFGLATTIADIDAGRASGHKNYAGTPAFEVPEYPQFCARSDVYQVALSIHCLARMHGSPVHDKPFSRDHPLPRKYDDSLRALLMTCLRRNPNDRPNPADLPRLVWKKYLDWRDARRDDGALLPSWAFG